jgi:hypothetical protein
MNCIALKGMMIVNQDLETMWKEAVAAYLKILIQRSTVEA